MFGLLKRSRKEVKQELDLSQLERLMDPLFDDSDGSRTAELEVYREERDQLQKQYGDGWLKAYDERHHLFVTDADRRKDINDLIYRGINPVIQCHSEKTADRLYAMREARMREVYGDRYDALYEHKKGDPEAVELLLQDAVKTGRWEELPECLQEECKMRMFGRRKNG